jgi:hypothetical protein
MFRGPPKYTQNRIFGMQINHLATLHDQNGPHKNDDLPSPKIYRSGTGDQCYDFLNILDKKLEKRSIFWTEKRS